ncbi:MAG: hypothetical protein JJ920_16890 [Roseitalea sp.]|jgi:hypothetical protein|nr:hypothetical protein [Roseitalea sp.]MBO6721408.1 hypothetical protein [Roseitalea sp.]MBO6744593.1 hypothetical protein [Roseitalea sp.]
MIATETAYPGARETLAHTGSLKQVELELALASSDILSDGFEASVRAACASCGLTFLFNLPVFDDPAVQRVAAIAWQETTDASPEFAFVTLDRDGRAVAVSAQCTCLDHGAAVALAWYDLIGTAE